MDNYKDKAWLHRKYWTEGLNQEQIADLCEVTRPAIYHWMKKLGIRTHGRSKALKATSYRRHNGFKRGHTPWNKVPVGTITAKSTGVKKKKRNFIKIAEPDVWVSHARHVWEKTRGRKIPKGFIICHNDLNTLNDDPKNLICIPRSLFLNFLKLDIENLDLKRLKKQQEYYQERKEAELRTKGKITPRKIITYVVDIECICGEKATYRAYEPNKKKLLRDLSAHWNGWQLSPVVRCEKCRQKKKSGEKRKSSDIAISIGG